MISIAQQISEVERELAQRREVYPRLVANHKMRQSIADYQTERMQATLATLRWIQKHEVAIKAAAGTPDWMQIVAGNTEES